MSIAQLLFTSAVVSGLTLLPASGQTFEPEDVDRSGTVDIFDLVAAQQHVRAAGFRGGAGSIADLNGDGVVDALDESWIRSYIEMRRAHGRAEFLIRARFVMNPNVRGPVDARSVFSAHVGEFTAPETALVGVGDPPGIRAEITGPETCTAGRKLTIEVTWQTSTLAGSDFQRRTLVTIRGTADAALPEYSAPVLREGDSPQDAVFVLPVAFTVQSCALLVFSLDLWQGTDPVTLAVRTDAHASAATASDAAPENGDVSFTRIDDALTLTSMSGQLVDSPCTSGSGYRVTAAWQVNPKADCYGGVLFPEVVALSNKNTLTDWKLNDSLALVFPGQRFTGSFDIQLNACQPFIFRIGILGMFYCGPYNAGDPSPGPLAVDQTVAQSINIGQFTVDLGSFSPSWRGIQVGMGPFFDMSMQLHQVGEVANGATANPLFLTITGSLSVLVRVPVVGASASVTIGAMGNKTEYRYVDCMGHCTAKAGGTNVLSLQLTADVVIGGVRLSGLPIGGYVAEVPQTKYVCDQCSPGAGGE